MAKRIRNCEDFKTKANIIHNGKYIYDEVEYINTKTKVKILCPIHGYFLQRPNNHISGQGCPKCGKELNQRDNLKRVECAKQSFEERANKVHNVKYDYSKVNYINTNTKICIICPEHGEFWQTPHHHLNGIGCPKCGYKTVSLKLSGNTILFIYKANKIHNGFYDYSYVNYISNRIKVCIICPKHGKFWQAPSEHLLGKGCPICNSSKLETEIRQFLTQNNIEFKEQYNSTWLGLQSLDFYLPTYNVAIECQGIQHFKPIDYFGGEEGLYSNIERDKSKMDKCNKNNVSLLYYSNLGINYPYKVYENKEELLETIKKCETF